MDPSLDNSPDKIRDTPLTEFEELLNAIRPMLHEGVLNHKKEILSLMSNYDSRSEDWCHFAHFDETGYTRNLVEDGSPKFNIMTMCWRPGQSSTIHGHEGANCFIKVKILCGTLTEERHNYPKGGEISGDTKEGFTKITLDTNNVHYIDDTIGVHKMINCGQRDAVSLHIYAPPYKNCRIFSLLVPAQNQHHHTMGFEHHHCSLPVACDHQAHLYLHQHEHHHHHHLTPIHNTSSDASRAVSSKVVPVEFFSET